jgi:hypothetical protein
MQRGSTRYTSATDAELRELRPTLLILRTFELSSSSDLQIVLRYVAFTRIMLRQAFLEAQIRPDRLLLR